MTRTPFRDAGKILPLGRLLASASTAAIVLTLGLAPAQVRAQEAFDTMVQLQAGRVVGPNGQLSQWTGASGPQISVDADGRPLMTIQQNQAKALLDWEDFRLKTNEILEFRQQSSNWVVVNRVHGAQAAEILGEIRAIGKVFVFNDNGVLVGADATINTRQLATGRGFSDVLVDGGTTTLIQSNDKAVLDWRGFTLQTAETLRLRQTSREQVALNRFHGAAATTIDGNITADGQVYLVAPKGLVLNGDVDAAQVVLSSLDITDAKFGQGLLSGNEPSFTNGPAFIEDGVGGLMGQGPEAFDPNDPSKYNVTIGRTASVTTGNLGKIMLFGPRITNRGTLTVKDQGQILAAAGEHIFVTSPPVAANARGTLVANAFAYSPFGTQSYIAAPREIASGAARAFYESVLGLDLTDVSELSDEQFVLVEAALADRHLRWQSDRADRVGYGIRNEGIMRGLTGSSINWVGQNLDQTGALEVTSTAAFRGSITLDALTRTFAPTPSGTVDAGTVTFGKGSLTQITPDLASDSTMPLPLDENGRIIAQSVGDLTIQGRGLHMREDSLIYLPGGLVRVRLDADAANFFTDDPLDDIEDGSRFMMDAGATIDLSGWDSTLDMNFHQVRGRLFAAELSDSPLQRDGVLYRKEIALDRRYGTDIANWQGFDNLNRGSLQQFLTKGGRLDVNASDDFIMKQGSVIDVSGGTTTYRDGYVYSTLLRRLDGTVIDIREADPDELYMGLANEWVVYDPKWGLQQTYYIPLMSSVQGKYETSYVEGGAGGEVFVSAQDTLLQGLARGETTVGRYQRANPPAGGSFATGGQSVTILKSLPVLVAPTFGFDDPLSSLYGPLFGFEPAEGDGGWNNERSDSGLLVSQSFFNSSTMGSYSIGQGGAVTADELPFPEIAAYVEEGVTLKLAHGASFAIAAGQRLVFGGSVETQGGSVRLGGSSLRLGENSRIVTRGGWYSDFEQGQPVALSDALRIDGGVIQLDAKGAGLPDLGLILPGTAVLDASGGGWVDRDGALTGGRAGDFYVTAHLYGETDPLDLSALWNAKTHGLAGNAGLRLDLSAPVFIANGLPSALPPSEIEWIRPPFLLDAGVYSSGLFEDIAILAPEVTVLPGTVIDARVASLTIKDPTLVNGVPASYRAPTGANIHDITEVKFLPVEQRSLGGGEFRWGMNIGFETTWRTTIGAGAVLQTEIGGEVNILGNVIVDGTLSAPGGQIFLGKTHAAKATYAVLLDDASISWLSKFGQFPPYQVLVGPNGRLMAPGAALYTGVRSGPDGSDLRSGLVLPGGTIQLVADGIQMYDGSIVDVSGASGIFGMPALVDGSVTVNPRELASGGGIVRFDGRDISVGFARYFAAGGGEAVRGGQFEMSSYKSSGGGGSIDIDRITSGFMYDFVQLRNGEVAFSLFGLDLSTVDWAAMGLADLSFEPGFVIPDEAALRGYFADVLQYGSAPMLVIGDPSQIPDSGFRDVVIPAALRTLVEQRYGTPIPTQVPFGANADWLYMDRIAAGNFSSFSLQAASGIVFSGDSIIGGTRGNGRPAFDTIWIGGGSLAAMPGANVTIDADYVALSSAGDATITGQLQALGIGLAGGGTLDVRADRLIDVLGAHVLGFDRVDLASGGDIRLAGSGLGNPSGTLFADGALTLRGDQVYAGTGVDFLVESLAGIAILPQNDGGKLNASPWESVASLKFRAPTITQSGIVRSPFGKITLEAYDNGAAGSGLVTLTSGSITSIAAGDRALPFGFTSNGDAWIAPDGTEWTTLPMASISLVGGTVDLQAGSLVDINGGGDLIANEFVSGIGGTYNWLFGYRDANYDWRQSDEIYAVVPGFDGDVAPLGMYRRETGVGSTVYLAGGSGLPAGEYMLLPAEYALLPGAYRVTAAHRWSGSATGVIPGSNRLLTDGSSLQSGFVVNQTTKAFSQGNSGFLVMPRETLLDRSRIILSSANSFFTSDAYLERAKRTNRTVTQTPRVPLDGGSLVLSVTDELLLNGALSSSPGKGGRGGLLDVDFDKVVITGANTDLTRYDGYLVLSSEQLSNFGAQSLLIGGTRTQAAYNLELRVTGTDIVVDNAGSTLRNPEVILASRGEVNLLAGAAIEATAGSGPASDLYIVPQYAAFMDDRGTLTTFDDLSWEAFDQGAVLRVSGLGQVEVLRDRAAVTRLDLLRDDPTTLAAVNASRAQQGLAPIELGGLIDIADGAMVRSAGSVTFDATDNALIAGGASLVARQFSASSSRIGIGEAVTAGSGLVLTGASFDALSNVEELLLRSYSSIDLFGDVVIRTGGTLVLDAGEIRLVGGGQAVIEAAALTLANSIGGEMEGSGGAGTLTLKAENIWLSGGAKMISGAAALRLDATQRVIGRDAGALSTTGSLTVSAREVAAESGARLTLEAAGAVTIARVADGAALPAFDGVGGSVDVSGATVLFDGLIRMAGGSVRMNARAGDVVVAAGSRIDVTGGGARFYDVTVGVDAGSVALAASGNILLRQGSLIDVSGGALGGDAGTLSIQTGTGGRADLAGEIRGSAQAGYRGGSFALRTEAMSDFATFDAVLDTAGFGYGRRFEIDRGDVAITGEVAVERFTLIANGGAITVDGTIRAGGDDGGTIRLSAAGGLTLSGGAALLAGAGSADGSGGEVVLQTNGAGGGTIDLAAGSRIDVSGSGGAVRLRAPQVGGDVAVGLLAGNVVGAEAFSVEAYRVYDGVSVINRSLIDTVSADAAAFFATNGAAIQARLGGAVDLLAGIELRGTGDMALVDDWNLSGLRFGPSATTGILTLRAAGDLMINADLSDGFAPGDKLMSGDSWSYVLTAGADLASASTSGVLGSAALAGKGTLTIGGTPDTTEYFYDPAHGNEHRLYFRRPDGSFIQTGTNFFAGYAELPRDAQGRYYIDTSNGRVVIEKDPVTGDYADTARYARRPLPVFYYSSPGEFPEGTVRERDDGLVTNDDFDQTRFAQHDNSTGYAVRTGTGSIDVATGADLILQEQASVLYTAGRDAGPLAGYSLSLNAGTITTQFGIDGGAISVDVAGDVIAADKLALMTFLRSHWSLIGAGYQTSQWVDHAAFSNGIGALGGGDVALSVGGDVFNLSVVLPVSLRTSGDGTVLHRTGGGDLSMNVGGDIAGGLYYIGEGTARITVGGGLIGKQVQALPAQDPFYARTCNWSEWCDIYQDLNPLLTRYDLYPILYTTAGKFDIRTGGDLNVERVMDAWNAARPAGFPVGMVTYSDDAAVSLFSAGGDVTYWANDWNVSLAGTNANSYQLDTSAGLQIVSMQALMPSKFSAVAASGDVNMLGYSVMLPSATGDLDLLAGGSVRIGYGWEEYNPLYYDVGGYIDVRAFTRPAGLNYRTNHKAYGLVMSQVDMAQIRTPTNRPARLMDHWVPTLGDFDGTVLLFTGDHTPDLHVGDLEPVRIYAVNGDVVTGNATDVVMPKMTWVQAGANIYFPSYQIQHNHLTDYSLFRAGDDIHFPFFTRTKMSEKVDSFTGVRTERVIETGKIEIFGPGRLDVEAGGNIWMGDSDGITSDQVAVASTIHRQFLIDDEGLSQGEITLYRAWHPDEKAADISVSAGIDRAPAYQAFEDAYLNPATVGAMADYLLLEEGIGKGKPLYLFDREYARAQGATGDYAVPEARQGLVNYVRKLQGLEPLKTAEAQAAYLDTAWRYWQGLSTDQKTPFYRGVLFLETRASGREATDPDSDRFQTAERGYTAIATLFPGAEKSAEQSLAAGESRWSGNLETYASRILSRGGGDVSFLLPGGFLELANIDASNLATGQPAYIGDSGDALRAGIVTTQGGEVNILAHGSVTFNNSRLLTTLGGNIMIWSSWGDIAAGKGAKTSISPQFYDYFSDPWATIDRRAEGLPTGAGIGTLATQPGTKVADVDLIAPEGIIDAGDAGIRVSGNLNVFAIEILGLDNIDVGGVATGLPVPPAAPPTSLDTGELSAKADVVDKALEAAVKQVQTNNALVSPSLIEVRVGGNGAEIGGIECKGTVADDGSCIEDKVAPPAAPVPDAVPKPDEDRQSRLRSYEDKALAFDLGQQPVHDAIRQIARMSGFNILFQSDDIAERMSPVVYGTMTAKQALDKVLTGQRLQAVRMDIQTIVLRRPIS